jgi:hypothetical protein
MPENMTAQYGNQKAIEAYLYLSTLTYGGGGV